MKKIKLKPFDIGYISISTSDWCTDNWSVDLRELNIPPFFQPIVDKIIEKARKHVETGKLHSELSLVYARAELEIYVKDRSNRNILRVNAQIDIPKIIDALIEAEDAPYVDLTKFSKRLTRSAAKLAKHVEKRNAERNKVKTNI